MDDFIDAAAVFEPARGQAIAGEHARRQALAAAASALADALSLHAWGTEARSAGSCGPCGAGGLGLSIGGLACWSTAALLGQSKSFEEAWSCWALGAD